jgi:threonine dehydratase
MKKKISMKMIQDAQKIFHHWFSPSPIEYCNELAKLLETPTIFKCEHLLPSGSYKLRGAFYALSTLKESERKQGVICFADHNFALSISQAADLLNVEISIILCQTPSQYVKDKLDQTKANWSVEFFESFQEGEKHAKERAQRENKLFLSSFEDLRLIAATGGIIGKEMMNQIPQIKTVIAPIGKKELLSGLIFVLKKKFPDIKVYGCDYIPDKKEILDPFEKELIQEKNLFADKEIDRHLDETISINSKELKEAHLWLFHHHHLLLEPSAAIAIAAALKKNKVQKIEGPVGLILSGRSFEEDLLKDL